MDEVSDKGGELQKTEPVPEGQAVGLVGKFLADGRQIIALVLCVVALAGAFYYFFFAAPAHFPAGANFKVQKGETLQAISLRLDEQNFIKNAFLFRWSLAAFHGEQNVRAGNYFFEKKLSFWELQRRLVLGLYGVAPVRVTVPEGWTVKDIGFYFENIGAFAAEEFYLPYAKYEGRMFPDTYFFAADNITPAIVMDAMVKNFENKITPDIRSEAEKQGKKLEDIIIMASLLEKEAADSRDRKIVSGILWKRLKIRMPLQVDAALTYAIGKKTFELTDADLKTNSPYNTYAHYGLPPGPIANPGLDAITAALYPEQSPYLYYLSDREGNMHYAATFDEHVQNKLKYLR